MKPADYCQFEHFLHHSRVGGCDKCRTRLAFSSHLLLCIGVALLPNVTNISKYWTQPTQSQESVPSDQGVLSDLSVYFLQTCLLILNSNPTLPPLQKKIYISGIRLDFIASTSPQEGTNLMIPPSSQNRPKSSPWACKTSKGLPCNVEIGCYCLHQWASVPMAFPTTY